MKQKKAQKIFSGFIVLECNESYDQSNIRTNYAVFQENEHLFSSIEMQSGLDIRESHSYLTALADF